MKIVVTSLSFYPDHSGISNYSSDFAFYAAEMGHSVEVITGFPFYPQWKKRKEDRRKFFSTEYKNNIKILRGYLYVPSNPSTFKRVLQEITLLISASVNFFRIKRPDVIVAFTTPISIGYLSSVFASFYRAKLVINVQDFQLEAAGSLGMANKNVLFSLLSKIEKKSYIKADLVTTISESMYNILLYNKNLREEKIYFWPNWIEKKNYTLDSQRRGIFRKLHNIQEDDTIIAYAGNVGLKQGLEILIDLAKRFKYETNIKFFIIGQGAAQEDLIGYSIKEKVSNIVFLPLLNSSEYLDFLNDLDIFFLSQRKTEFDVYFPSKLLGLMAAKKLILLTADKDSELYKTIQKNNIGFVTEFADIEAICIIIKEILLSKEENKEVSDNAITYVSQYEKGAVLNGIIEKIKTL